LPENGNLPVVASTAERFALPRGIAIWRGDRQAGAIRSRRVDGRLKTMRPAAKCRYQAELSFKTLAWMHGRTCRWFSCVLNFLNPTYGKPIGMAGSIVVRTQNPLDITPDEAEEIAATIRGLNLDGDVRVEEQEREDRGLTWFEILHITLAFKVGRVGVDEATEKIADIVVDWARERFRGRKSGSRRPVYLEIRVRDDLGARVVKAIVIKNAKDEPEDRAERRQMFGPGR
jgi:hypothetical protein